MFSMSAELHLSHCFPSTITNITEHIQQLQGYGRLRRMVQAEPVKEIIQGLFKELDDAVQLFGVSCS
jgi:hypothetical protein